MGASVPESHHALLTRPLQQYNRLIKDIHTLRLSLRQVSSKVHRIPLIAPVKCWYLIGLLRSLADNGLGCCCCGLCLLGYSVLLSVPMPSITTGRNEIGKLTLCSLVANLVQSVQGLTLLVFSRLRPVYQ